MFGNAIAEGLAFRISLCESEIFAVASRALASSLVRRVSIVTDRGDVLSAHHHSAAGYIEDNAGDPCALLGCQEERGARNVFGRTETS